ncbi:hypothetical protein BDV34DRAFT_135883 [Aspergillus parasiticus]|uniref:Uncharacterized protein n=1 Tax=Aspergillus parasiticus TaxID=5067 RepID=A0A5N6DE91_ASPPA|nr:hypothetical protein BDV34DRAFT_135883 [Aspergillus parasiticus]
MDPQGPLYPLWQAFLTPAKTSELQTLLQAGMLETRLGNLFLLSSSIHSTFRSGHIQFFPQLIPPTSGMTRPRPESKQRVKFTISSPDCGPSHVAGFPSQWQPMDNADVHHGNPRRQYTSSRPILSPNALPHCSLLASIPC